MSMKVTTSTRRPGAIVANLSGIIIIKVFVSSYLDLAEWYDAGLTIRRVFLYFSLVFHETVEYPCFVLLPLCGHTQGHITFHGPSLKFNRFIFVMRKNSSNCSTCFNRFLKIGSLFFISLISDGEIKRH